MKNEMKNYARAGCISVLMLVASPAWPANLAYELTGMGSISVFGSTQNPIADLLGIERNSSALIPINAKFIIDADVPPFILNGSVANGGEFFYWDALLSASLTLNETCFGANRQPKSVQTPAPSTADEAEIKITYSPSGLDAFELSMKGRANLDNPELFTTYTVPVGEVVNGQLIENAEVFMNIVEFNALGADILDNEKIPESSTFLDTASSLIIGFQLGAIPDIGIAHGGANLSIMPNDISGFTVTRNPQPPMPDIKINGSDELTTLPEGGSGVITVSLAPGFMDQMCTSADWWVALASPTGWRYYELATGAWVSVGASPFDLVPTYQGSLFDLPSYEIANTASLNPGRYTVYFAIDTEMNGVLDLEHMYFDLVEIDIQFPTP